MSFLKSRHPEHFNFSLLLSLDNFKRDIPRKSFRKKTYIKEVPLSQQKLKVVENKTWSNYSVL